MRLRPAIFAALFIAAAWAHATPPTDTPTVAPSPTATWTPDFSPQYLYVAGQNNSYLSKYSYPDGVLLGHITLSLPGNQPISSIHGFTRALNGVYWILYENNDSRALGTVDLNSGAVNPVRQLDQTVTSLALDAEGNIYTVRGGEASDHRFWVSSIDSVGHVAPLAFDGDGDGAQALAYDYDRHRVIHAVGKPLNRLDYFDAPLTDTSQAVMINGSLLNLGLGSAHALAYAGNGEMLIGLDTGVYRLNSYGISQANLLSGYDSTIMGLALSHDNAAPLQAPAAPGQSYYWVPDSSTTLRQYSFPGLLELRDQAMSISFNAESLNNVNGMARNPATGEIWVSGQTSGTFDNNNNFLGKLDPSSGAITRLTSTGESISSLAFKPSGELFAATDSGGSHPHAIVKLSSSGGAAVMLSASASAVDGWTTNERGLAYNAGDGNFYLTVGYYYYQYLRFAGSFDPASIRSVTRLQSSIWGRSNSLVFYQPGWMLANFGDLVFGLSQSGEYRFVGAISGYSQGSSGPAILAGDLIPTETPTPSLTFTPTGSDTATGTDTFTRTPTITPTFTGTPYASLSGQRIYAADHDGPYIHEFDPSTGADSRVLALRSEPGTPVVVGLRGLAVDPTTGIYYVTGDDSGSGGSARCLYTVDMGNGLLTKKGTCPYVSSIAFDGAGNLYGSVGCDGSWPGDIAQINKNDGFQTDWVSVGACGSTGLFYRPQDGQLYEPIGSNFSRLAAISITAATSTDVYNGAALDGAIINGTTAVALLADGNFLLSGFDGKILALSSETGALMGQVGHFPGYFAKGMIASSPIAGFGTKPYYTPVPRPTVAAGKSLIAADAFSSDLYVVDPSTFNVIRRFKIGGFESVSGFNGLAYDSGSNMTYAVVHYNTSDRHLLRFDSTGTGTEVGALNDYVATIAFDGGGQLYGVIGDTGSNRGMVVPINKSDASIGTPVGTNSSCGVAMAFDSDDSLFYVASGCGFNGLCSYDPANSFLQDNLTVPNNQGKVDSALALVYLGDGSFIFADRNGTLRYLQTNGSYTAGIALTDPAGAVSYSVKGLAFVANADLPTPVATPTPMPTPAGKELLALSAFTNDIYKVSFDHPERILASYPLSVPGYDFSISLGLALDPVSGLYYIIFATDNSKRYLGTFNAGTGQTAVVGAFADGSYIASLAFDASGQLYGVKGNNASADPGSMVPINKANAALGTPFAAGNSNGQALAFDPDTNSIFKAGGQDPVDWMEIDVANQGVSTTVSVAFNEPHGLTYYENGVFLLSSGSQLYAVTAAGQISMFGYLPGNTTYKGLALVSSGPFPTPTLTPQRTQTPVFTPTPPAFMGSDKSFSVVGPVPAKRDQPICLAFPAAPLSSSWEVYNTAGELVAKLSFGSESQQCWDHPSVAAGLYYLKLKVSTANGDEERWQKIAIVP